jgi:hypothetical protein
MIEVDAGSAYEARMRRRTWMLGGGLLVLSALLGLGMSELQGLITGLPFDITQVLFWAGAVVLAIGLGRSGSVTARRKLGTGVIVVLAVWQTVLSSLVWAMTGAGDASTTGDFSRVAVISTASEVVALGLAIIAVMQIGRAGVVPKPWNWAPLWVLAVWVAAQLLPTLLAVGGSSADPTALNALFGFFSLLKGVAIAFLGVLAIVLALRPAPGTTVVYGSGE